MPVEIRPIGRSLESTSAHPFHEGDRRNEFEKSTTAIRRWQNLSGRDAVRESDGSSERSFPAMRCLVIRFVLSSPKKTRISDAGDSRIEWKTRAHPHTGVHFHGHPGVSTPAPAGVLGVGAQEIVFR